MRRNAKAVNFGIVYGQTPFGLAQQLGIDRKEAELYIRSYFERYSGVREFIDRTIEEVRPDRCGQNSVRQTPAHPRHAQPKSHRSRICGANRREHSASGHGRGSDQSSP